MTTIPAPSINWQTRLAALNDAPIGVVVCDRQARMLGVNDALCQISGYCRAQLLTMSMALLDVHESASDATLHAARIVEAAQTVRFQTRWRREDGVLIDVDVAAHAHTLDDVIFAYVRDITELTNISRGLARSHALLRFLSRANALIARVDDLPSLYQQLCESATQLDTHIVLAWIGLVVPNDIHIDVAASAGSAQPYLAGIKVVTDKDRQEGQGPTGQAIREQRPIVINDYSASPATLPWRDRAATYGIASAIAIPLAEDGRCDGALMLYSTEPHTFDDDLVALLMGLGENISHAMTFVRQRNEKATIHQELEQSRKTQHVILDATDETIAMIEADGYISAINRIGAARFGGTPQALVGSNVYALLPPDLAVSRRQQIDNALASGQPASIEDQRNGRWFHSRIYPITDGKPRVVIYAVDITDTKASEKRLAESEQRYRNLFENSVSPMLIIDPADGRIADANAAASRFYGWPPETLVGMSINAINAPPAEPIEPGLAAARADENNHFMLRHRIADGSLRDVEVFSGPIQISDRSLLYSIVIDVTPQRRNTRRIQALLDIAAISFPDLSEEDFLNRGLEHAEAVTNSAIGFLHFVNEDQETIELVTWTAGALRGCTAAHDSHYPISQAGIWADCFRDKKAVVFNDYPGYAAKHGLPDGHAHLQRLISVPVIEEGKVRMMIGVGNKTEDYGDADIETVQLIGNDLWRVVRRARAEKLIAANLEHHRELNRKLEEAHNQLLQSEKMSSIGQLTAGIAHELNNPIGFVHSNLGTLESYLKDIFQIADAYASAETELAATSPALQIVRTLKQQKDFDFLREDITQLMAESKDGLNRVKKIVQDLKDFSRVGEVEWQIADIHKGLDSTLNMVWNELKYKCTVTKHYADNLPLIYCLPSQLNQVFMNLLVNSAHAIVTQGEITLTTCRTDDTHIQIEFKDNGSGIAPENLKRIFDPFFTTKPVGKGTGLGLSIAYGIIGRHHGSIAVTSAPGIGTTFTITLPIQAPEPTLNAAPVTVTVSPASTIAPS